ncbi:arsenite methyltransferase [Anaeramoeba ignava]|uniref:Arsenite methyltransferase n=1 Tax=Anaeramoeba ignava TaxID=1746090 RepID=A0A9Q0LPR4_ANAIG|nr:arsenite methyltransferase [Anaeramoeba ignava]|eukprot:Anaeramoba_ignava/a90524_99.p1 GENE.a90524_99~~a90524_99.p1  ORF type:complete len:278 (-),score=101.88 a90524_99:34-867(-)
MEEKKVSEVNQHYSKIAKDTKTDENYGKIAESFGYSKEDLEEIPKSVNMGLSCGNPTSWANIQEGETILDLGCGAGMDLFLAAKKVGEKGTVYGLDMSEEMIERGKKAIEEKKVTNVHFLKGRIETIPLENESIDCVISNCVLNLVPIKSRAFAEIYRVLKKGGRLVASDIALKKELPEDLREDAAAYVGCIAGAIPVEKYKSLLEKAGFVEVNLQDTVRNLNVHKDRAHKTSCGGCCCKKKDEQKDEEKEKKSFEKIEQYDLNDFASSFKVFAKKN